ncbi:MAG: glucan biosynthesis protein G [Rhizobiales bacterium]|jgi:glucans biosynthesis protein|nr:glucan biosynthesis protein G [Hyphomicrobiales bacterium]
MREVLLPNRRRFLAYLATTAATAALVGPGRLALAEDAGAAAAAPVLAPPQLTDGVPFGADSVIEIARKLAAAPFEPLATELPPTLANLDYVQYRDIYYKADAALWKNEDIHFLVEFFHRGFYFKERIDVAVVKGDEAYHVLYEPRLFGFGDRVPRPLPEEDIGFAGFRIGTDVARPKGQYTEFLVFQGASYFRSLAVDQAYGISARGLAVKTAAPEGEEFPVFRSFWVERPKPGDTHIVIYALLDSPSVAGAYRFRAEYGNATVVDVEATLFPRVDLAQVGLAPGTSMFFFDMNGRVGVDDYRPEVHDSDGLLIYNGVGERLWRPLSNPKALQVSSFVDQNPRGFGLIQRNRAFDDYQDVEAAYERRPSLWVEPVGDWGPGSVVLVEIPTDAEIHDNIVAYWTPKEPIKAGSEFSFSYRLTFGDGPAREPRAVYVERTRRGRADAEHPSPLRLFVVDFALAPGEARPKDLPKPVVTSNGGSVGGVTVHEFDEVNGWRLTFKLDPGDAGVIELRAGLVFPDKQPSETWVYRWTGD